MLTYQDFEAIRENEGNKTIFIEKAIRDYRTSDDYITAGTADEYNRQQNSFIIDFVNKWYESEEKGIAVCNNLFNRLNTQRCTYSLGNGISFEDETTKEKLGADIDDVLFIGAYNALIHKKSYFFFNVDRVVNFTMREFLPLVDEETNEIRAGIRFWQIDSDKPCYAVLYEEDGYTKYKGKNGYIDFEPITEKQSYIKRIEKSEAFGEKEIGSENYGKLPIVAMYGTRLEQSTLVGMKRNIDALDLIKSGFADNVANVQQIYWIIDNAGGMNDKDKKKFKDDIMYNKVATVNSLADGVKVTPHQNAIPTDAHEKCIKELRSSIYEDFGALDVHTIAAGATNDHIDAAYQPMDENADDFEYQVIGLVRKLLSFTGIEDATPIFKRNRVSNQKETTEMVLLAAPYLDDETIVKHLPFISVDELETIKNNKADIDITRLTDVDVIE